MRPSVVKLIDGPYEGTVFSKAQAGQFDPQCDVWKLNGERYRKVSWDGEVLTLAYLYGEEE
jgi:hypothetical protein